MAAAINTFRVYIPFCFAPPHKAGHWYQYAFFVVRVRIRGKVCLNCGSSRSGVMHEGRALVSFYIEGKRHKGVELLLSGPTTYETAYRLLESSDSRTAFGGKSLGRIFRVERGLPLREAVERARGIIFEGVQQRAWAAGRLRRQCSDTDEPRRRGAARARPSDIFRRRRACKHRFRAWRGEDRPDRRR